MNRNLFWMRRDLRLHDNHALMKALETGDEVYLVFCFDSVILNQIKNKNEIRVSFIYQSLIEIEKELNEYHSGLIILHGDPKDEIVSLSKDLKITSLYYNRDYEPYAKKRDDFITKELNKLSIEVHHFKDHVFFEKNEVLTNQREIYKVFTPYKNKWLEKFKEAEEIIPNFKCNLKKLTPVSNPESILLTDWFLKIGFKENRPVLHGGTHEAKKRINYFKKHISNYHTARDFINLNQTSNLSPYLRFGNISIRDAIRISMEGNSTGHQTFLSELIWRDFYQMILDVFPKVETKTFKADYENLKYQGEMGHFHLWCIGKTGFPIVDAAMRCLNETGLMHNRLRMIVASFLTKTLLIDYRHGENYFKDKLLDYDLAANNGGWQWSASTGVDAQPYFRIFNPFNQSEKYDPKGEFIKKWCPELKNFSSKWIHFPHESDFVEQSEAQCFIGKDYPYPIVSYKEQKEKALLMFKK